MSKMKLISVKLEGVYIGDFYPVTITHLVVSNLVDLESDLKNSLRQRNLVLVKICSYEELSNIDGYEIKIVNKRK